MASSFEFYPFDNLHLFSVTIFINIPPFESSFIALTLYLLSTFWAIVIQYVGFHPEWTVLLAVCQTMHHIA